VPIVYKAQRTLLESLVNSVVSAFGMIAIVMTVLLLWGSWQWRNAPAGLLSMLPNIFPVVIIFGFMGHRRVLVDIGTMMCASVAMGVAVDDTIHFLAWFRHACRQGMPRKEAVLEAYRRVATAMTQTTLIAGLGLAVFALSTFTPTQRFGVMMLTLLTAALVGDLVMLPAMLASPLGRIFEPKLSSKRKQASDSASDSNPVEEPIETQTTADEADKTSSNPQMPHQASEGRGHHKLKYRRDSGHKK
jgi:predicted RND superfamily exporter protein